MSDIQIAVSGSSDALQLLEPLLPSISEAFQPFGVNLIFGRNLVLQADPELTNKWPDLVGHLHQQSRRRAPGHLVVTNIPPASDLSIDGRLCDPPVRGVVAVYLGANLYYRNGGAGPHKQPALLAAVCVHELGHLLNLTHDHASRSPYASAMSPATLRVRQAPNVAWQKAMAEAAQAGEPPVQPPNPVWSHPFNGVCRHGLREVPFDPRRLPFGSPFAGGGQGASSDELLQLELDIIPHEERPNVYVGGPLYLTLAIRNGTDETIDLPLNLGTEFETVRLVVTDPDGRETRHRPRGLSCSGARQDLGPGQRIFRSLSFTGREDPRLFATPGPHRCRIEIIDGLRQPKVRLAAAEIELLAHQDSDAEAASRALRKVLDRKGRGVGPVSRPQAMPAAIGAHIELAVGQRLVRGPRRKSHLELGAATEAPRSVRHGAARLMLLDRLYRGVRAEDLLGELRDQFQDALDDELHEAARRSAEGFALSKIREVTR